MHNGKLRSSEIDGHLKLTAYGAKPEGEEVDWVG